jgi:hypothetical protein
MALQQRNPNESYRSDLADDNLRPSARMEEDLQLDPQLSEGQLSGGKIAAFAVAIALAFGAIFYGMNVTSNNSNTPSSTAQTTPSGQTNAQNTAKPAPAVRDVTPYNNQPGTTTGAAPTRPQTPDAPAGNAGTR